MIATDECPRSFDVTVMGTFAATIAGFDLEASSIPKPTWDYLTSLEWISARENLTLIGPAVVPAALDRLRLRLTALDDPLNGLVRDAADLRGAR